MESLWFVNLNIEPSPILKPKMIQALGHLNLI